MTLMMDGIEYVPVADAAMHLGTTELKILMLLRQKALCGTQIEGGWFVTSESLATYQPSAPEELPAAGCGGSCRGCGAH
ncbi:hypothetical protein L4X63_07345 [Geomonas sp. Red32]|uniref:hypothetical protein n=1 Tax=Geomonas sp. Red32 TaxID=2912856 RepID=UPI00202CF6A7|nr:hypothetical protein [Geomonas sp. Red32]MCM0081401.1 hypothetical protein [Geomonas sp. Red32]